MIAFLIVLVDASGGTPDTQALNKRTVPLLIEYFYVIALIGMLSSSYRQRFGDRWVTPTSYATAESMTAQGAPG